MQDLPIAFTPQTQTLLQDVSSDAHASIVAYMDNALVREALNNGQERHFVLPTEIGTQWFCAIVKNASVSLQFFEKKHNGQVLPMEPHAIKVLCTMPTKPRTLRSLDFHRANAFLDRMVHAAHGIKEAGDTQFLLYAMQAIAAYVPRADQALRLAQRLHSPTEFPHEFISALTRSHFFGDYFDDAQEFRVTPITTVRTLLDVHAGVHLKENTTQSAMYALDTPSGNTTYLFIKPKDEDSAVTVTMWLDGDGTPMALNRQFDGSTCWWADNPEKPKLQWAPDRGRPQDCTVDEHHRLYFNETTSQYCTDLANATPRKLSPAQEQDVVQQWVDCSPSMEVLWKNKNTSALDYGMRLFHDQKFFDAAMQMWGQWAVKSWAEARGKEHKVLETLLGGIGGVGSIEEWRQTMRAMSREVTPEESFDMPDLLMQEPTP